MMRRRHRAVVGLAVLGLGLTAVAAAGPASAGSAASERALLVPLQLLAFNDYHGHTTGTDSGTLDGQKAGGGVYLAATLNQLRQGKEHSLTVAAGDLVGASPFSSGLFHDEPSIESLNAMGLDVSSVGNHEFDEGVPELLRKQNGGCHPVDGCYFPDQPFAGADFQYLAANVQDARGRTVLPPYWITKVEGIKVGFIGMTLEGTDALVAAAGVKGWTFKDEAATANALVPVLRAQGVRAIVVLLHEGGIPTSGGIDDCVGVSGPIVQINQELSPEIDALITGHTHQPYNCVLNGRTVTSAFEYGKVVSEVNLVLDKRTRDVRRDLTVATNHAVLQAGLTPDPAVQAVVDKWAPLSATINSRVVGTATADIKRGGTNGSDRGVESPAGNLVADAQRWATSAAGAQIAFMNPGGLRTDLLYNQISGSEKPGELTFGEAFAFQPFNNQLVTFPMTGAQIQKVLEQQCQPKGSSRPFLHLGVSQGFTYDLSKTFAVEGGITNCVSVSVTNMRLDGVPIDPTATYKVTANNFLADGGDNFPAFKDSPASSRVPGGNDLSAFVTYLGAFSPVAPPGTDRVNEIAG